MLQYNKNWSLVQLYLLCWLEYCHVHALCSLWKLHKSTIGKFLEHNVASLLVTTQRCCSELYSIEALCKCWLFIVLLAAVQVLSTSLWGNPHIKLHVVVFKMCIVSLQSWRTTFNCNSLAMFIGWKDEVFSKFSVLFFLVWSSINCNSIQGRLGLTETDNNWLPGNRQKMAS